MTKSAINAAQGIAAFSKRFQEMHTTGTKAAELVQTVGIAVLEHHAMHQNTTLVNAFFQALPPGINYKAITAWLVTFGGVRLNTDPTTSKAEPFKFAKGKATDAAGAKATPWYTIHGANIPKAGLFDIQARMVALVKAAAKAENLQGDFQALRAAAIAMGVDASSLPTDTDAALAAKEAATGKKMARTTKANKQPAEVDPLGEATPL